VGPTPDPAPDPGGTPRRLHRTAGRREGFDRTVAQLIPLFAAVGALSILAGLIPFPRHRTSEVLVGGVLFFALTATALLLPWSRLPRWCWLANPIGYLAVIALIRDAQGGSSSGLGTLYLLPIVWLAFYGRRSHLVMGLVAMVAALTVPIVLVGGPAYPVSQWRMVVINTVVASLVSFTFLALVARDRASMADMAEQSLLIQQGARQAEEARERLASLLRAATETAVVGTDPDGLVTFFSAGAERLLGYSGDEAVGRLRFYAFIDAEELARHQPRIAQLASAGAAGTGGESIWTFVRRDGTRGRMSTAVTPQPTATGVVEGEPAGYVVVATDVTEREQLVAERERLLDAQREVTQALVEQNHQLRELTQMKDDVVDTVSHELRTPLTSIRGFVELLLDGDGTGFDDEQIHMLRAIDRNSLQLLRVADDLLEDPGRGRGLRLQFVDTDLSVLVGEAVDAMMTSASDHGVDLSVLHQEPVVVHGDPVRLHQLLGNLLANAVKFTPTGGRVAVRVLVVGQFARLDVLDDGPGVPLNERSQLFDRFFRLASSTEQGIPGTGLGLAIAKAVVEAHQGTIEIVDTPGWSSTFRVHLPAVDTPGVDPPPPPPRTVARDPSCHALSPVRAENPVPSEQ
jgi:PAS domain S-box-containing protein